MRNNELSSVGDVGDMERVYMQDCHSSAFSPQTEVGAKHLAQNPSLLKMCKSFLNKKGKVLLTRVKIFIEQTRYGNLILSFNLFHFF